MSSEPLVKVTSSDSGTRQHGKVCMFATTKIVGDKWTPLLLFALAEKPRRFCELQTEAGGINPRTLSARLDFLEEAGVVSRTEYQEMPPRVMYALTEKGEDLLPIIRSMIDWAEKYHSLPPT